MISLDIIHAEGVPGATIIRADLLAVVLGRRGTKQPESVALPPPNIEECCRGCPFLSILGDGESFGRLGTGAGPERGRNSFLQDTSPAKAITHVEQALSAGARRLAAGKSRSQP
jgi:hypothetical protein